MISIPTKFDMQQLIEHQDQNCISIYTPFIQPNSPASPTRILFKNQVAKARRMLVIKSDVYRHKAKALRPAIRLLKDSEFWRTLGEDTAMFMGETFFACYKLPADSLYESLYVQNSFVLTQLENNIKQTEPYYILGLSQNEVKLYEYDNLSINNIGFGKFETNMRDNLRIDENQKWTETHTIAPASTGRGSRAYHGQYNLSDTNKRMLASFFRNIDKYLQTHLKKGHPLVLAGVERLIPIYKSVSSYPLLEQWHITGSIEHLSSNEISRRLFGAMRFIANKPTTAEML
jgi:Bacterial archaeo-eukaryotic release factor family 7